MNEEDTSLDFFLKQWLSAAIEGTVRAIVQDTIRDTVTDIVRKEINNFLERFNDNARGPLKEVHKNIDNLRNEHIADLKNDLKNVQNALYILQDIFGELKGNVDGLRGELSDIKKPNGILEDIKNSLFKKNSDEIQRLKDDIARLKREIDKLEKSLQDEKAKVIAANQNYSNAVTRLNVKDGELSRTQRELDDAKGKIAAKESELNNTKNELSRTKNDLSAERESVKNLNEKLSTTKNALDSANTELTTTKGQLIKEKEEATKTSEKLNDMTSSLSIYEPVRTAITKCAIFSPIVEKYGLDDMSNTGLIKYAKEIGTTDSFAFEIYNTALENKKQTKEYMTADEAEVYDALNKVYRQNWNIQHDIFALPDGQNVNDPFKRTNFDSTTSLYLHEPRDKNLPYTTGIYVPIRMNKDGRVSQKAYVDAANR